MLRAIPHAFLLVLAAVDAMGLSRVIESGMSPTVRNYTLPHHQVLVLSGAELSCISSTHPVSPMV